MNFAKSDLPTHNVAHAQMLMEDAKALHANKESPSPSESPDPDKDKEKRFIAWSGKLEGIPGGPHNCARPELLRWLTALLCFIEAQCFALGHLGVHLHVREFCRDPGMPLLISFADLINS